MNPLFVDAVYWVALANVRDQWHQAAREIAPSLASRSLLTIEPVLTEFLNYFASFGTGMRRSSAQSVRDLLADPRVEVIPQTHALFLEGLALYETRLDKGYSVVDCMSMQVMRRRGLAEVLTHDDHFAQEGFTLLL